MSATFLAFLREFDGSWEHASVCDLFRRGLLLTFFGQNLGGPGKPGGESSESEPALFSFSPSTAAKAKFPFNNGLC